MRITLPIIIILIGLTSCTKRFCTTHYPCDVKDSVSYIERLDTIIIPMPADTVYLETPIDCPDQQVIYREGKHETRVVIKDKILKVYGITAEDSLRVLTTYKRSAEYQELTKVKEVVRYKAPHWAYYLLLFPLGIVLYFAYKYRKFLLRLP